ncbi:MAG TPA: AAA family ATPase [Methylomirabilota bacterium]
MYTQHFRLNEPPFSITPDPRYLYLSPGHRDALAHLLYGVGEGGGFVQLTGEVGTGKTTLCRCLLEQLPPGVNVALILNPRLTSFELLAAVCDELRIAYPPNTTSRKLLVDLLYHHLLDVHGRGERTALIIDEAQDLAPEVLEEIRLLTNLETSTRKLLQIILIGQPELTPLLEREDLRQLAQRVTARYHLVPFGLTDTRIYVRHRLMVAGARGNIFTDAALREVYRVSGGVPRLINSVCDRALLGAYTEDRHRVDPAIVQRAAAEVLGRSRKRWGRPWQWAGAAAIAGAIVVGSVLLTYGQMGFPTRTAVRPAAAPAPAPSEPAAAPGPVPAAAPPATPPPAPVDRSVAAPALRNGGTDPPAPRAERFGDLLADPAIRTDKVAAFRSLYTRWELDFDPSRHRLACDRARAAGMQCLFKTGGWTELRRLDVPVIIELKGPGGEKRYVTVVELGEQTATLDLGGHWHTFPLAELERYWDGFFIAVWKAPAVRSVPIVPGSRGKDVAWLRQRLGEIDGRNGDGAQRDVFDDELKARVVAFQRARSLVADGVVGDETLAQMGTLQRDGGTPRLVRAGS